MTNSYLEKKILKDSQYDFLNDIFFELEKYLPEKIDRDVVIMVQSGYNYKEIHKKLDIPYGQVRTRYTKFIDVIRAEQEGVN